MLRVSLPLGLFVHPVALYANGTFDPPLGGVSVFTWLTREVTAQSLRYGFLSSDDFHVCASSLQTVKNVIFEFLIVTRQTCNCRVIVAAVSLLSQKQNKSISIKGMA